MDKTIIYSQGINGGLVNLWYVLEPRVLKSPAAAAWLAEPSGDKKHVEAARKSFKGVSGFFARRFLLMNKGDEFGRVGAHPRLACAIASPAALAGNI